MMGAYSGGPPQQPVQQVVYVAPPQGQKPGILSVLFGLFTVLAGLFCLVILGIGGGGVSLALILSATPSIEAIVFGLVVGCIPTLLGLFGLVAGAILAARGGAGGWVLSLAFWAVILACCLCFGGVSLLVFGGAGTMGLSGY